MQLCWSFFVSGHASLRTNQDSKFKYLLQSGHTWWIRAKDCKNLKYLSLEKRVSREPTLLFKVRPHMETRASQCRAHLTSKCAIRILIYHYIYLIDCLILHLSSKLSSFIILILTVLSREWFESTLACTNM
jgi:hypothetical protein